MITKRLTDSATLSFAKGVRKEMDEEFLVYAENFFEYGFQDHSQNRDEMTLILSMLEDAAKKGNETAGAVLAKAILSTFSRRQVVEDALSFMTRAMRRGVRDAAVVLCHWYDERRTERDFDDFEDEDVGVEDCYDATPEDPRVNFPKDEAECVTRMLEAILCSITAGQFEEVLYGVMSVLIERDDVDPRLIKAIDVAVLAAAEKEPSDALSTYASFRMQIDKRYPHRGLALKVINVSVAQNHPYSLGMLGTLYKNDSLGVVKKDAKKAFDLLSRAVEGGDSSAMIHLAACYYDGFGVEQDTQRASDLVIEAADRGVPEAHVILGRNLVDGGLKHDDKKSVKHGCELIRAAAEEDDIPEAWEAMLHYHEMGVGPFKTNKFARAARAALKRIRGCGISLLCRGEGVY